MSKLKQYTFESKLVPQTGPNREPAGTVVELRPILGLLEVLKKSGQSYEEHFEAMIKMPGAKPIVRNLMNAIKDYMLIKLPPEPPPDPPPEPPPEPPPPEGSGSADNDRDYINQALASIASKESFPEGFIVVYDLNAYSAFQRATEKDSNARRKQEECFHRFAKKICEQHKVSLLQAPAGDKLVFYMQGNNKDKFQALMQAFEKEKVETGLTLAELQNLGLNADDYPNNAFLASIGADRVEENTLFTGAVIGNSEHDQGANIILGAPYFHALEAQGKAKRGEVILCESLDTYLNALTGTELSEEEIQEELVFPSCEIEQRILIAAMAMSIYPRGSISDYLQEIKARVQGVFTEVVPVNSLGLTTIFLGIGERSDLAQEPDKFISTLNFIANFLSRGPYSDLFIAKTDENFLILQTKEHPHVIANVIRKFYVSLSDALSSNDNLLNLSGAGVARDAVITRTANNILGGFFKDGAGPGYVNAARLAKLLQTFDQTDAILFHPSVTLPANLSYLEHSTYGNMLALLATRDGFAARKLIGIDSVMQDINGRIARFHSDGNVISLKNDTTRIGFAVADIGGFGRAACLRQFESKENASRLSPLGTGPMQITRALLYEIAVQKKSETSDATNRPQEAPSLLETYEKKSADELQIELEKLLLEDLKFLDGHIFIINKTHVSELDLRNLQLFINVLAGQKTVFIHALDYRFDGEQEPVMIKEKTNEEMCEIICQARLDITVESKRGIRENLIAALNVYFQTYQHLPRTPRLANKLANGMRMAGQKITLPAPSTFTLKNSEAGVEIENKLYSSEAKILLCLLSHISADISYKSLKLIINAIAVIALSDESLKTALLILLDNGFIRLLRGEIDCQQVFEFQDEDQIVIFSKDMQIAAAHLHDPLNQPAAKSILSSFLIDKDLISKPDISDNRRLEIHEIVNAEIWWTHEMRKEELNDQALVLTHAIAMFYYRKGNLDAAARIFSKYFETAHPERAKLCLEKASSEKVAIYLDMARVFVASSAGSNRDFAKEVYQAVKSNHGHSEVLESVWYLLYRLPIIEQGEDLKERDNLLNIIASLQYFINTIYGPDPLRKVMKYALQVELLYRELILYSEDKASKQDTDLKQISFSARALRLQIDMAIDLPPNLPRIGLEAHNTARRILQGVMKKLSEHCSEQGQKDAQLAYLLDSTTLLEGLSDTFRKQDRPDFEQAREVSIGYCISLSTYIYNYLDLTDIANINITELRDKITTMQSHALSELGQFLRDGAPRHQKDRMFLVYENACYVALQLEAKIPGPGNRRDWQALTQIIAHYKWARSERKLFNLGGDAEKRRKALEGSAKQTSNLVQRLGLKYADIKPFRPNIH